MSRVKCIALASGFFKVFPYGRGISTRRTSVFILHELSKKRKTSPKVPFPCVYYHFSPPPPTPSHRVECMSLSRLTARRARVGCHPPGVAGVVGWVASRSIPPPAAAGGPVVRWSAGLSEGQPHGPHRPLCGTGPSAALPAGCCGTLC